MKTIELTKKIENFLSEKSKEIGIHGTTPFILPKSNSYAAPKLYPLDESLSEYSFGVFDYNEGGNPIKKFKVTVKNQLEEEIVNKFLPTKEKKESCYKFKKRKSFNVKIAKQLIYYFFKDFLFEDIPSNFKTQIENKIAQTFSFKYEVVNGKIISQFEVEREDGGVTVLNFYFSIFIKQR
jgi:hypothetical protein